MGNQATFSFQNDDIPVHNFDNVPKTIKDYTATFNHINYSILIYGGYPGKDNHVYELSMKKKEWNMIETNGKSPTSRYGHTGTLHHEFYFIFGGTTPEDKKLNDLHFLDLNTYKWTEVEYKGNPPSPRSNHSSVWYKNTMIIYGGEQSSKKVFSDCFIFNFSTLSWSPLIINETIGKTFPRRSSHSVCIYGDQMMIFGGKDSSNLQNDTYLLNLDRKKISKLKTKNEPTKRIKANLLTRSGIVIMFGGFIGSQKKPQNYLYMMRLDNLKWVKIGLGDEVIKNKSYHLLFSQGNLNLLGGDDKFQLIDQLLTTNLDEYIKMMSVPYSELEIDKQIAENAFVRVFEGKWRNQPVAIKEIKDPSDPEKIEKLMEQAKILKKLKHPCITEFKCFVAEDPHYCLVLQLSSGSISNFLHHKELKLSIDELIKFTLQIANGLKYLHSLDLIYGVLTTRRIQFNENHVILSDFFLTYHSYVKNDVLLTTEIIEKVVGCPYFVGPEILKGKKPTPKSDVFSLGTVMYEMYSKARLSRDKYDTEKVVKRIIEKNERALSKNKLNTLIFDNEDDSKVVKFLEIIQESWKTNPEERPDLSDIIDTLKELSGEKLHLLSKVDETKDSKNSSFSEKYEIVKQIGIGGQARVYRVVRKSDGKEFALKRFNETPFSEINKDFQEMRSYVGLSHPSILSVVDFFLSSKSNTEGYCSLNIVMDFCDDGDLYKIIKQKEPIKEEVLRNILIQLFDGLAYLHSKSIIHRDIKPNNIMLISDGTIKIGDLGLARESNEESATTFCGTIEYMSPEQRTGLPYDLSVDVWAAGMIVFELLIKKRMHYSKFMKRKQDYLDECFDPIRDKYSKDFFDIASSCLSQNSTQRPTAKEILKKLKGEHDQMEIPTNLMTDNFDDTTYAPEDNTEDDETATSLISSFSSEDDRHHHKPSISLIMDDGLQSVLSEKSPKMSFDSSMSHSFDYSKDNKSSQGSEENKRNSKEISPFYISYSSRYSFINPSKVYGHREVIQWSKKRVGKWLNEMNLGIYEEEFMKNEINGETLLELNETSEFLQFLNIRKLGHIKMIQKYIQLMRESSE
eukprot:gene11220-4042_t